MSSSSRTYSLALSTTLLSTAWCLSVLCVATNSAHALTVNGFRTLRSASDLTIDLTLDDVSGRADMILTGPDDKWFGVGFGQTVDANAYTIIALGNGDVQERKLGNHSSGTVLSSMVTVHNNSVDSGVRTVELSRDLIGDSSDHYTFSVVEGDLDLIWAVGSSAGFGFHAHRGTVPISLSMVDSGAEWANSAGGFWHNNHWSVPTPPNGNDADATFGPVISAASSVIVDMPVTVRSITLNSPHEYNIAGTQDVHLASNSAVSDIRVLAGSHQFQANVALSNATTVDIDSGSSLTFSNLLELGGNTLTKMGSGSLFVNNNVNSGGGMIINLAGSIEGTGSIGGDLSNNGGTVSPGNANSVTQTQLPEPTGLALFTLAVNGFFMLLTRTDLRQAEK